MEPCRLDAQPELEDTFAELIADGAKRGEIAAAFGIHPDTVTTWKRRPTVQQKVTKLIQDRANRILRHTDTRIEKKLEANQNLGIETLLKIRREFAGADLNIKLKHDSAESIQELLDAIDEDPALAEALAGAGKA